MCMEPVTLYYYISAFYYLSIRFGICLQSYSTILSSMLFLLAAFPFVLVSGIDPSEMGFRLIIPNGHISSGVVSSSLEVNRLSCGSKCLALGYELCKGFNWFDSMPDSEGKVPCELVTYVTESVAVIER